MALPNIGTLVRSSGRSCDTWSLEYTCGASGAVTLDTDGDDDGAWTDQDPRVSTPVEDSGNTGLTTIRFPKCRRVRVLHCSIEEPTAGTAVQMAQVVDILPSSGTASVRVVDGTFALADATTNARVRVVLQLEYN